MQTVEFEKPHHDALQHKSLTKAVKREFNRVGLSLFLIFVVSFVVSLLIYTITGAVLGIQYSSHAVHSGGAVDPIKLQTTVETQIKSILWLSPFSLLVSTGIANFTAILVYLKRAKENVKSYFGKSKVSYRTIAVFTIVVLGCNSIASQIPGAINGLLFSFHLKLGQPNLNLPLNSISGAIMMSLSALVIAPITEEFIFRGIALNVFKKYGLWFSIFASSFLWAIIHVDLVQAIPVFFMGIILGLLALKSGSIIPTIIIHIINNLLSTVVSALAQHFPSYSNQIQLSTNIALVVLALIFFVVFRKEFRLDNVKQSGSPEKVAIRPFRTLLYSWSIILVIIMAVISLLLEYVSRTH